MAVFTYTNPFEVFFCFWDHVVQALIVVSAKDVHGTQICTCDDIVVFALADFSFRKNQDINIRQLINIEIVILKFVASRFERSFFTDCTDKAGSCDVLGASGDDKSFVCIDMHSESEILLNM